MTSLNSESRRQRILRMFYRSGQEGHWTRPFEELPLDVREQLLGMAEVQGRELPVLSYFRDEENWVLLTTEQLIAWRPQQVLRLPWSELENATVDAKDMGRAVSAKPHGKLDLTRLQLILRRGDTVELELEAGAAFFGFWNVLKMVAAMGKP